jgi:H+/gluconate symporter-like permease
VIVAGPLFGRFIAKRIFVPVPAALHAEVAASRMGAGTRAGDSTTAHKTTDTGLGTGSGTGAGTGSGTDTSTGTSTGTDTDTVTDVSAGKASALPSFRSVVGALLLPLALIVLGTIGKQALTEGTAPATTLMFVGHPVVALLVTCLYTLWFFGVRRGASGEELRELASSALAPAGQIILITGAGGAFGGVLVASGLGEVLAEAMEDASVPLVVFGFLTASVIRICQGSGMIAMITGATFSAPLAEALGAGPSETALTTIAIACGGAAFSHVNDSGFWMANRYFGMSVADTLKSWTVMKTTVGVTGFAAVLALSAFTS